MPKTEVDTTDTTQETEIEAGSGADTADTADINEQAIDYVKNLYGTATEKTEEDTSKKESEEEVGEETEDTETEEEAGDADEEQEVDEKETKLDNNIFELEENGKVEKIDISTEEGRSQAEKFMKAGRYVERVRHEQKEKENSLNQLAQSVAYQTLYLQNQGKLSSEDFAEKPFEDFIGVGKDDAEDRKLWSQENARVKKNISHLSEFTANHDRTAKQFNSLVNNFSKNHPEITDVSKWIQDNIMPYHAPIFTYGNEAYPEDTLEAIYFYKNKDSIIKAEVNKAVKDYVKKPTVKQTTPSQVKSKSSPDLETSLRDNLRKNVFNTDGRKLSS
jgi:hypothetical protein